MRSADDTAGLAIATRLREDIARMKAPAAGRVVGIDPALIHDRAAFTASTLAMGRGDLEGAGEIAADLMRRYPGHPEAAYTLALVGYWHFNAIDEAVTMLEGVVQARPAFALAWYNLGFLRQRRGEDLAAIRHYTECLRHDPTHVGAHVNLGNAKLGMGDIDGALACYAEATRHPTTDGLAIYNRAIAHLLTGDYAKGWADYEARWDTPLFRSKVKLPPIPIWDGSDPKPGQRLLVWAEQGYGDTLMAWRYATALAARFGKANVGWAVQPSLAALLRGEGYAVVSYEAEVPEADLLIPTMSLPHRLGMPTEGAPYMARPRFSVEDRKRVGYVWAGDPAHEGDARRSTRLEDWADLHAMAGIDWVNLQVGRGSDFVPASWAETATLVAGLDLVITVDTAVAHLAGAMGVPVWILLPAVPDYRWGLTGDRTVWYDSARLYRQAQHGQWAPVFQRVRDDLAAWVSA